MESLCYHSTNEIRILGVNQLFFVTQIPPVAGLRKKIQISWGLTTQFVLTRPKGASIFCMNFIGYIGYGLEEAGVREVIEKAFAKINGTVPFFMSDPKVIGIRMWNLVFVFGGVVGIYLIVHWHRNRPVSLFHISSYYNIIALYYK
nr:hypothetical protein [Tanacetum cinerariifolium]